MAAYRYWRFFCTADNGANLLQLNEIEMFSTSGAQLFVPVPSSATSSSLYSGSSNYVASNLFDGNVTDFSNSTWAPSTSPFPHWAAWDMGVQVSIGTMRIYPVNFASVALSRAPRDFVIQARNSESDNWVDIAAFAGLNSDWTAGIGRLFAITFSATARLWRVIGLSAKGNADLEISAFELYNNTVRVDGTAALLCTQAPSVGTVAALQDGNLLTVTRWPRSSYSVASFALVWDFTTATTITAVCIGAGASADLFLDSFRLETSTDGVNWLGFGNGNRDVGGGFGLTYPGANSLTPPIENAAAFTQPVYRSSNTQLLTVARASDQGPTRQISLPGVFSLRDVAFGGKGKVQGTVKVKGTPDAPASRRVRLIREKDGLVVREQFSNALTGVYSFIEIDESQTYTVLSYDYTNTFRAVVADNLTPELMPGVSA